MTLRQIRGLARSRAIQKGLTTKAAVRATKFHAVWEKDIADYRAIAKQVCTQPLYGPIGDALSRGGLAGQRYADAMAKELARR